MVNNYCLKWMPVGSVDLICDFPFFWVAVEQRRGSTITRSRFKTL